MNPPGLNAAIWPAIRQFAEGDGVSIRISGSCMLPYLKNDANVAVRTFPTYLPGDILVVQRRTGKPIVHRLIGVLPAKRSLRYYTQADNSPTPDGSVTREAIVGKVCGGQCSPLAVNVPPQHRAKALSRFLIFLATRITHRTWSLLKTT